MKYSPVTDLGDLLAAMPAVLGFRPCESVVIAVCEGRAIELTLRVDVNWFMADFDVVADHLCAIIERYPCARVFLLGYSEDRTLAETALNEAAVILGDAVADIVLTDGRRWWSLRCPGDCCPPEGRPFSYEDSKISAEAVVAGVPISRTRDEVVAGVFGPDERAERELTPLFTAAYRAFDGRSDADLIAALFDERARALALEASDAVSVESCARVAVLLDDPDLLSALVAAFTPESAARDRAWLLRVSSRCLERFAPNVLAALAVASWLAGGGPVLSAALERLHDIDPGHPVIRVLNDLIVNLVTPRSH